MTGGMPFDEKTKIKTSWDFMPLYDNALNFREYDQPVAEYLYYRLKIGDGII